MSRLDDYVGRRTISTGMPVGVYDVGDWVRDHVLQVVGAVLMLVLSVMAIGAAGESSISGPGPLQPEGWKPLRMQNGRPKPNEHACGSMTWGIDPRGSRYGGFEQDAIRAAAIISQASGIRLKYVGHLRGSKTSTVSVNIGWAGRDVVGEHAIGVAYTAEGDGSIYLLRTYANSPGFNGGWGSVLLHEWGHVIGLDHVSDPNSIMNKDGYGQRLEAADRRGLWALGRGSCS